jgi:hypothetical protein
METTGGDFTGRVYFKYDCGDAWLFYRFVRALAETGAAVGLEWSPMPTAETESAVCVHARIDDPTARGRFLHAMFGLVHIEGLDASAPGTVARAAREAGLGYVDLSVDHELLATLTAGLSELGVTSSPSLYRHGPVTAITLNPAVLMGDVQASAATILAMTADDGIWELKKP